MGSHNDGFIVAVLRFDLRKFLCRLGVNNRYSCHAVWPCALILIMQLFNFDLFSCYRLLNLVVYVYFYMGFE